MKALNKIKEYFLSINTKWKFFLTIIGTICLLGLIIIIFIQIKQIKNMTFVLRQKGITITRYLAANATEPMLKEDIVALQRSITDVMFQEEDVAYAYIIDANGYVVVHSFGQGFPTELLGVNSQNNIQPYSIQLLDTEEGYIQDIAMPILDRLGVVHVGMSENFIRQNITETIWVILIITFITMTIGVLLISFNLFGVLKPLDLLTQGAKEISNGNWALRIDIDTKNELGVLAKSFNKMVKDLHQTILQKEKEITERKRIEGKLKEHQDHLEELVKVRTTDLEDAKDNLESLLADVNKATEELTQANSRLLELDRLKSMFIASMSHEFRTPLNSIIGFTGVVLQGMAGEINDEQKDQLQRAYGSAKHLLALISDIIDISEIEAGTIQPHVEEFQLDEIIKQSIVSLNPQLEDKGLTLKTNIPQSIKMTTDKRRLIQCIINYLSNAIKFSQEGRINITAIETDGKVEITVNDSGIGIKEKDIPKLFKSFVRLDSPLKTTILGTGLGLYLTKKITSEILGGSVSVASQYGKGSTFTLNISKTITDKKKAKATHLLH